MTRIDDRLVQILDVERVLGEVLQRAVADPVLSAPPAIEEARKVLVVDDSAMARNQSARTLEGIGVEYLMARDGREAMNILERLASEEGRVSERLAMVISDIEMPEMDGYTLASAIRGDARLDDLYVLLHTSLNGAINIEKAVQAGADTALTKFVPDELAACVLKGLREGHRAA